MIARALTLAATAAMLAAMDLALKAGIGGEPVHRRSLGYVVLVVSLSIAWAGAIVLARSTALAVGGGILAGGAVGNVASLAFWPGVPNTIVGPAMAFNLADVFVLVGFAWVVLASVRLIRLEPERLGEPLRLR